MTAAEKIAALRAKHGAASPGKWQVTLAAPCFVQVSQVGGWVVAHTGDEMQRYSSEDAHAIAAARNNLPVLLKALEEVLTVRPVLPVAPDLDRPDRAQLVAWTDGYNAALADQKRTIEAALAEVAR